MILTCPDCATSYFVDDDAIGDGRTVRCAACGVSWKAQVKPPLELRVTSEEGAFGADPPAASQSLEDDPLDRPAADVPGEELPKVFRAKAATERRTREAAVQGVVWAGTGAVLAVLVTAAVVFRVDVVRMWPRSASAYAGVGLPVNRVGLTIEGVRAQPSLQDGRPALVVSGLLRNIRTRAVSPPPLSIALLDKDGRRLAVKHVSAGDEIVPPGQTRTFAVSLVNPPMAASDLEVTFLIAGPAVVAPRPISAPRLSPAAPDAKAMLLAPSIEEVKPLPPASPYALPASSTPAK